MSAELISLDEASWRLEQSDVSGRTFAELLLASEPLLLGVYPGSELHAPIDLSRVISFHTEPENVVVVGNVKWAHVKLDWSKLRAALATRGRKVTWSWLSDITPEVLERSRQRGRTRPLLGDLRPPARYTPNAPAIRGPARRAQPEWFAATVFVSVIPASGKAPLGKRGPKSGKRENTVAAITKEIDDKTLTVADLRAMPEKELAYRYGGVSRDTARKARNDVLLTRR
jgi:hypothetical protein